MTLGSTSRIPFARFRSLCVLCVSVASLGIAAAQDVKQAGTDVPAPKRTKFVAPTYPPEAQANGQRGIVILELVVDVDGKVGQVTVVRSVPPFDEAALSAVRQWEYEVSRVDGKPVAVRLTVPITFALKLPTVARASGVPELRMGAAPALPPQPWSRKDATVEADVTIDPDGQVSDALVTAGDSPWAEALLQALRTWRFAGNPAEGPLTFKATARFTAEGTGRVDLELTEPRRTAAAAPAAPDPASGETAPATAGAMPAASAPATPPSPALAPTQTTLTGPAAPVGAPASPAPVAPPPPTVPPATTTSATRTPPAKASVAGAPAAQAPPTEVVPAAPPPPAPPAPPEGGGGSAVRGIQLGAGVPDLVSGRRPVVPPLARLQTVTGKVLVRFAVDASGSTSAVEAEGSDPLREAARQAVASWIFRRTRADRLQLSAEFDYGTENATASVGLEAGK